MAPHAVGTVRRVERDVEQRLVVGRPGEVATRAWNGVGEDRARLQVHHVGDVLLGPGDVLAPREASLVGTHGQAGGAVVAMAGGALVLVEQDLFEGAVSVTAPAQDRVLLPRLGAEVVQPATFQLGHA